MDLRQWGISRNTSLEIATAIRELSSSNETMQSLWENPSPKDRSEIISRAWTYASLSQKELYWYDETIKR